MPTIKDKIKWKLFELKRNIYITQGLLHNKIRYYDDELIDNLSNIYYGGIPASVSLLLPELSNGKCYDRALLLTTGFNSGDLFQIVRGNAASIALNPMYVDRKKNNKYYADHCVVERVEKDGTWVYDTSMCVKIERDYYYKMQQFDVRHISSKYETQNYYEYQTILNADLEKDKYAALLILPLVEEILNNTQSLYKDKVIKIINEFKEKIQYNELYNQMIEDIKQKRKVMNNKR